MNELANLLELSLHLLNAKLTACITQEWLNAFKLTEGEFLIEREVWLFKYIVTSHEKVLAWNASEWRAFKEEYFSPIKFPTIDHKP